MDIDHFSKKSPKDLPAPVSELGSDELPDIPPPAPRRRISLSKSHAGISEQ